jgi:hypothetical protein
LGVNGMSAGLFQQMYDIYRSQPIFHSELDTNFDDRLTVFDLKLVRFNAGRSIPVSTVAMNATASQAAAFAPAAMAETEMGVAAAFGFSIFQNPVLANDVNSDARVSPNDALIIINHLNSGATQNLATRQHNESFDVAGFVDTNGDFNASPIDVLQVINQLNASVENDVEVEAANVGEGEEYQRIFEPQEYVTIQRDSLVSQDVPTAILPAALDQAFSGNDQNRQREVNNARHSDWSRAVDQVLVDDTLSSEENLLEFIAVDLAHTLKAAKSQ